MISKEEIEKELKENNEEFFIKNVQEIYISYPISTRKIVDNLEETKQKNKKYLIYTLLSIVSGYKIIGSSYFTLQKAIEKYGNRKSLLFCTNYLILLSIIGEQISHLDKSSIASFQTQLSITINNNQIKELQSEIEELKLQIKYMPHGTEYSKAEESFNSLKYLNN